MSYEFQPDKGSPKPRGSTAFDALSLKDQSRFCLSGGEVYDDRPKPVEPEEYITSAFGTKMAKSKWDTLTGPQQAAFIMNPPPVEENQ